MNNQNGKSNFVTQEYLDEIEREKQYDPFAKMLTIHLDNKQTEINDLLTKSFSNTLSMKDRDIGFEIYDDLSSTLYNIENGQFVLRYKDETEFFKQCSSCIDRLTLAFPEENFKLEKHHKYHKNTQKREFLLLKKMSDNLGISAPLSQSEKPVDPDIEEEFKNCEEADVMRSIEEITVTSEELSPEIERHFDENCLFESDKIIDKENTEAPSITIQYHRDNKSGNKGAPFN